MVLKYIVLECKLLNISQQLTFILCPWYKFFATGICLKKQDTHLQDLGLITFDSM